MPAVVDALRFTTQWVRHPRRTGAVAPSGKQLSRAMVAALGDLPTGSTLIELGPGTGVFTREAKRALPQQRLVAVERCAQFAAALRKGRVADEVIEGCAAQLAKYFADQQVGAVMSGLPLLSLPFTLRDQIFDAIRDVLPIGQPYVQFTYSRRSWRQHLPAGFRLEQQQRIWRNIPPATVMTFIRE